MSSSQIVPSKPMPSTSPGESSEMRALLHTLSNKILPIVVFSELSIRRCEDVQLKPQLEKIHAAAEQARDLLVEIRALQREIDA